MVFLEKKIQKKHNFLPFFNATFQCGRYGVFKKRPQRSAQTLFPLSSPGHSPQPKIDFPYHEISGRDIFSLICDQSLHNLRSQNPNCVAQIYVIYGNVRLLNNLLPTAAVSLLLI